MNILKTWVASGAVAAAVALPLQTATAWGGPWGVPGGWGWGGPGAWGAPGLVVPPGIARLPGWSPEEVAEKYDFYGPYGPSITDIRRFHRDLAWGRPYDGLWSPMGPSPTDIRREIRREFLRDLRGPFGY